MLGDNVMFWLAVGALFIPKVLARVEVRVSEVLAHQTGKNNFFMELGFCPRRQCHVETGKGPRQTVATEVDAQYCLKYH